MREFLLNILCPNGLFRSHQVWTARSLLPPVPNRVGTRYSRFNRRKRRNEGINMSIRGGDPIDNDALNRLFRDARTFDAFQDRDVPDQLLRDVYELARMAPTSANCQPLRILFLRSTKSREMLAPALSSTNRDKTLAAPVTAIIAHDLEFPATLAHLYRVPGANKWFSGEDLIAETAFRNGSLQGAYFMLAARAVGLDVGPMSGFDNAMVDAAFFGSGDYASWRSNFICNLGFGDAAGLPPRDPRPDFSDACRIV